MRSFVSITILSLLYGVHTAPLSSRPSIRASSVVTRSPELRPELLKFRRLAARLSENLFDPESLSFGDESAATTDDDTTDPLTLANESGSSAQTGEETDFETDDANVNDVTIENGVVTSGSGVVNGEAVSAGDALPPLDDEDSEGTSTDEDSEINNSTNEDGTSTDEDGEISNSNSEDDVTNDSTGVDDTDVEDSDSVDGEDGQPGSAVDGEAGSADAGDAAVGDNADIEGGDGNDGLDGGAGDDTLDTGNSGGLINVGLSSTTPRSSVNTATLNMVKSFEGFEPSPKKDPVGLFTVGFGHKCLDQSNAKCAEVPFSFPMSRADADQLLLSDMQEGVVCVNQNVKVALNDNQFGALASFAFNGGCGLLRTSTLLKRLNAGENPNTVVTAELPKFNKGTDPVTKKKFVLNGLTRRRAAEVALFTS